MSIDQTQICRASIKNNLAENLKISNIISLSQAVAKRN